MTTFAEHCAEPNDDADQEARTGLPGVPTWRGVYGAVLAVFGLLVVGMTIFSMLYA